MSSPIRCKYCGKIINRKERDSHLLTHSATPYECQDCGEQFATLEDFNSHLLVHRDRYFDPAFIIWPDKQNADIYTCPFKECSKPFEQDDIGPHIESHRMCHQRCPVCNAMCKSSAHVVTHLCFQMKKCHLCPSSYFSAIHMMKHLQVKHACGIRGWRCRVCSGFPKFVSVSALEKHLYSHLNNPFTCQLCYKDFKYSSALQIHWKMSHLTKVGLSLFVDSQNPHNGKITMGGNIGESQAEVVGQQDPLCNDNTDSKSDLGLKVVHVQGSYEDSHEKDNKSSGTKGVQESVQPVVQLYESDKELFQKKPVVIAPLDEPQNYEEPSGGFTGSKDINNVKEDEESKHLSSNPSLLKDKRKGPKHEKKRSKESHLASSSEEGINVLSLVKQIPMHCSKPECKESFPGPVQFWAHFRSKHWSRAEGNQYLCMTCWQLFRHYGRHQCDYFSNNLIANTCPYCGQLFKNIQPWRLHTTTCKLALDKTREIRCFKCQLNLSDVSDFLIHVLAQHKEGLEKFLYVCQKCGVSFGSCDTHSRTCIYQASWIGICTVCQETVKVHERFDHAMACTGRQKPMFCPSQICDKTFSQGLAIYEHYRDIHWEEEGGFKWLCHKCGRFGMDDLESCQCCQHTVRHHLCLYCGKRYFRLDRSNLHMKTCLGSFPYDDHFSEGTESSGNTTWYCRRSLQCMYCKAKYNSLTLLSDHVFRDHRTFAPSPRCWFCIQQGRFPDGIQLWQHMRKHHSQWSLNQRFLCVCCGSSFTSLQLVNEHQVYTHGFLVPIRHICSCCGNLFDTKDGMKKHRINCFVPSTRAQHSKDYDHSLEKNSAFKSTKAASVSPVILSSVSSDDDIDNYHVVKRQRCEKSTRSVSPEIQDESEDKMSPLESEIDEPEDIRGKFKCPGRFCMKRFAELEILWKHYQRNHWEVLSRLRYICTLCGHPYTSAFMMTTHSKVVHSGLASSQNLCTFCGDRFDSSQDLDTHFKACERAEHVCEHCGKHISNEKNLWQHIVHCHKSVLVQCKRCRKYCPPYAAGNHKCASKKKNSSGHVSAVTKCSSQKPKNQLSMKQRMSPYEMKTWTIRCVCKRWHRWHQPYNKCLRHVLNVHSYENLKCAHCNKVFSGIENIMQHMLRVHEALSDFIMIPVIRKAPVSFPEQLPVWPQLAQAVPTPPSSSTRLFKANTIKRCAMCTKAFINLDTLQKHMKKMHNTDIPVGHATESPSATQAVASNPGPVISVALLPHQGVECRGSAEVLKLEPPLSVPVDVKKEVFDHDVGVIKTEVFDNDISDSSVLPCGSQGDPDWLTPDSEALFVALPLPIKEEPADYQDDLTTNYTNIVDVPQQISPPIGSASESLIREDALSCPTMSTELDIKCEIESGDHSGSSSLEDGSVEMPGVNPVCATCGQTFKFLRYLVIHQQNSGH